MVNDGRHRVVRTRRLGVHAALFRVGRHPREALPSSLHPRAATTGWSLTCTARSAEADRSRGVEGKPVDVLHAADREPAGVREREHAQAALRGHDVRAGGELTVSAERGVMGDIAGERAVGVPRRL